MLRAWQAARLARTHRDLLESRRFHAAAEFFLTDIYGPRDLSRHIEEVRRIVPMMTSVLPDSGLATVAHAMELNALSESLDGAMVEALGEKAAHITDEAYAEAYRAVDRTQDRGRQIDLIELLGQASASEIARSRATTMVTNSPAPPRIDGGGRRSATAGAGGGLEAAAEFPCRQGTEQGTCLFEAEFDEKSSKKIKDYKALQKFPA